VDPGFGPAAFGSQSPTDWLKVLWLAVRVLDFLNKAKLLLKSCFAFGCDV
jgi:hypothetical protein